MKRIITLFALCGLLSVSHVNAQCEQVSMIGEFNDWNGDLNMVRVLDTFDLWVQSVVFTVDDDTDGNGFVGVKFRENGSWTFNWGNVDFPSGVALPNGPYTDVPYGAWDVSFNCYTLEYNFQVQIGVEDNPGVPRDFNIYPNPSSSSISLDLLKEPSTHNSTVSICNLNGQELINLQKLQPTMIIDISSLPAGIYFVKLTSEKSTAIKKLIKID